MLPQDFAVRMKDMLKEDYDAFLKSYENEKYQALRVNPLKAKDAAVEEKAPFSLTKVPWAAHGFYYDSADQPGKHPYHEAGVYLSLIHI